MSSARPVRNTHTVGNRLSLTPEAQRELVAEAMAQATLPGERSITGVLGGISARFTPSQLAWYRKEQDRSLRAARKAAQAAPVVDVLAAPERHTQPEQRHYAHSAQTATCHDCGKVVPEDETDMLADETVVCLTCADDWRTEASYEPQDGPHAQPEQQQAQRAETGYPEAGYQTLAEGLRRLAAGRKALPAPLTYEQSQTRWRAHMAEATRLQESLRTAPLEQVEGIRQQVHAELRECQRLTDLEQALLGEVRW